MPGELPKWSVRLQLNFRILQASKVPEHAVMANRTIRNHGTMEAVQVERALNHRVGAICLDQGVNLTCRA